MAPPNGDRKSKFPKAWSQDSPITWRQIVLMAVIAVAGYSVGGVVFALKSHEDLPGHPVIVKEFADEREKQRLAMTKLTRSIDKLTITLNLQGDGTWQRVNEATGGASAGP